jgi:hypothetical protein
VFRVDSGNGVARRAWLLHTFLGVLALGIVVLVVGLLWPKPKPKPQDAPLEEPE